MSTSKGSPTKSTLGARASVRNAEFPARAAAAVPTPGSPVPAPIPAEAAVAAGAAPTAAPAATGAPPAPEIAVPGPPASEVKIQLDEVLPVPGAPAEPVKVPVPADLSSLPIEDLIRTVFGPEGEKAVQVARCESTLRPHAKKGQFLGLFQMGANERTEYGHGDDPLAQVLAAHALFLDRGWQPWTCA
ncbi:MAG TPA: hypothetical protein VHL54_09130 [Actinomycetota bacterium]|nr:hypothetical protein [Actinomycetota bacterium]